MAGRTSPAGQHLSHGGAIQFARVKGGAAGSLTVTGIATTDVLYKVMGLYKYSGLYALNTSIDFTAEFSIIAANTINNTGGTTTSNWVLFVSYEDMDA